MAVARMRNSPMGPNMNQSWKYISVDGCITGLSLARTLSQTTYPSSLKTDLCFTEITLYLVLWTHTVVLKQTDLFHRNNFILGTMHTYYSSQTD